MPIEFEGKPPTAAEPSWTDIFNERSFTFLASVFALAVIAWEYRRRTATEMATGTERGPPFDTVVGWLVAGAPLSLLAMAIVETYAVGHARHWIFPTFVGLFSVWTALIALALLVMAVVKGPRWMELVSMAVDGLSGVAIFSTMTILPLLFTVLRKAQSGIAWEQGGLRFG